MSRLNLPNKAITSPDHERQGSELHVAKKEEGCQGVGRMRKELLPFMSIFGQTVA